MIKMTKEVVGVVTKFPSAFSVEDCDRIVSLYKDPYLDSQVELSGRPLSGCNVCVSVRRGPYSKWESDLRSKVLNIAYAANESTYRFYHPFRIGDFAISRYSWLPQDRKGFVPQYRGWHCDGLFGDGSRTKKLRSRKLTVLIQLSDRERFSGSNVIFKDYDWELMASPEFKQLNIGDALVFPAFTYHACMPITSGVRYSASAFISGPPLA